MLNGIALLKCRTCAFVYSGLPDVEVEQANFHFDEEIVERYRMRQSWVDRQWFASIVRRVARRAGIGRVLDVGCGNGVLLREFVKSGWQGFGVDPSPWAVQCADGYEVFQSTLHGAGFPDGHFDVVTNTAVLEHVAQPHLYVEEVLRILRPGGCAYFNVPNYGSLSIRLGCGSFRSNTPPWHANYFTHRTLAGFLDCYRDMLSAIAIRSYGIPEAYGAYVGLQRLLHGAAPRRADPASPRRATPLSSDGTGKRAVAWLLGKIYYHAGRPFHLGDKLEALLVKAE